MISDELTLAFLDRFDQLIAAVNAQTAAIHELAESNAAIVSMLMPVDVEDSGPEIPRTL